jgi:hypothetical protein
VETNNEEKVLKARSARSCIAAGYRLFTGHFRQIVRNVWVVALVYALVSGVVTSLIVTEYPRVLIGLMSGGDVAVNVANTSLAFLLGQLFLIIVTVMLAAAGFSLLNHHRATGELPKAAKWYGVPRGAWLRTVIAAVVLFVIDVIVSAVIVAVAYGSSLVLGNWTALALNLIVALLILALLVPMTHPMMKYVTTNDSPSLIALLAKEYGKALRYWGLIFIVLLVTTIVTWLAVLLTTLPAVVLTVANMQSALGTLQGDPTGMPHYMGWLKTVVFCISGFIQAFVLLSALFPVYFMSLSVEAREIEKMRK